MTSEINTAPLTNSDATPADEIKEIFATVKEEIENLGTVATVTLTSAQVLALNATPITVIEAAPAGYAHIVDRVEAYKPAGTAYAGIATGEDLVLRYTNGSGTTNITIETTGFLDQTTAQVRSVSRAVADFTPTAAAPIVAHMSTGEIITGDSPVSLRITYRTVPVVF